MGRHKAVDGIMPMTDPPGFSSAVPLLSSREFAGRVGVTPETVRRWVRNGRVLSWGKTPTGQLRFHPDQVRELLQGPRPTERAQDIEAHVLAAKRRVERLRKVI